MGLVIDMKRFLFLIAALMVWTPAQAAVFIADNGPPFTYSVHANHAGSGTTLTLLGTPGGNLGTLPIVFSSATTLDVGNGNGVATLNGPFSSLTIKPGSHYGFTAFQFKLDPKQKIAHNTTLQFDATVAFAGGGSQTFADVAFDPNNKFDLKATGPEVITSIVFSNLELVGMTQNLDFADMKQISFNAVNLSTVPEPSTWTLLLVGFFSVGMIARRRNGAQTPVEV